MGILQMIAWCHNGSMLSSSLYSKVISLSDSHNSRFGIRDSIFENDVAESRTTRISNLYWDLNGKAGPSFLAMRSLIQWPSHHSTGFTGSP